MTQIININIINIDKRKTDGEKCERASERERETERESARKREKERGAEGERCRGRVSKKGTESQRERERARERERESERGRDMQRSAGALFIFTGTFQELTAIPLSGVLNRCAIFQTPDTQYGN